MHTSLGFLCPSIIGCTTTSGLAMISWLPWILRPSCFSITSRLSFGYQSSSNLMPPTAVLTLQSTSAPAAETQPGQGSFPFHEHAAASIEVKKHWAVTKSPNPQRQQSTALKRCLPARLNPTHTLTQLMMKPQQFHLLKDPSSQPSLLQFIPNRKI